MSAVLTMSPEEHESIWTHLLGGRGERAAFAYAETGDGADPPSFRVRDIELIPDGALLGADQRHVALRPETHAGVIKRAWESGTSIVEFHSHPWVHGEVAFSYVDLDGLREFVPHCWWRLRGRPYLAIVVAGDGSFDALVWVRDAHTPEVLTCMDVGGEVLAPSNCSIAHWSVGKDT